MLPESWQYFTEILKKQCVPKIHSEQVFVLHHFSLQNCCQKCSEHCDLGNTFCRPKKRLQDGGILMNAFLQMRLL